MALGGGGWHHSGALKDDGTLWNWGDQNNYYSHVLDCDAVDCKYPQQVGSDTDWDAYTVGKYHNLAIKYDSTLWSWAYNEEGQLGLGATGRYVSNPTVIR